MSEQPLQRLSLAGMKFPNLGVEVGPPPPTPPEWLLELEPTSVYEGRLLMLLQGQGAALVLPGMPPSIAAHPAWYRANIARTQAFLNRSYQRDALQLTRPEGCWCLGVGARRIAHEPPWSWDVMQVARLDKIYDYCTCPEAEAVRELHEEARESTTLQLAQERHARLWAAVGIPEKFEHLTLATMIALDPSRANLPAAIERWEAGTAWMTVCGTVGKGKTGLLCALLKRAVERGETAMFVDAPRLLDRLRATFGQRRDDDGPREADILAPLYDVQLLGLDDVGAADESDWALGRLRVLINERYARERRTVVTTNLSVKRMGAEMDQRIASRLLEAPNVAFDLMGRNLRDAAARHAEVGAE